MNEMERQYAEKFLKQLARIADALEALANCTYEPSDQHARFHVGTVDH